MFNLIGWILFGALVGWLASIVMKTNKSQGLGMDIVIGIVGSMIGGFVTSLFGMDLGRWNPISLLAAVGGAVLLLYVMRMVQQR